MSLASRLLHLPLASSPPASLIFLYFIILNLMMAAGNHTIDQRTTLKCHVRSYQFRYTKPPYYDSIGNIVTCTGLVTVNACWGRCDSSEVGDYILPFRISHHPVCTYTGRIRRLVSLSECEGYPDPTVEVFDAAGCECRPCDSEYTSCEHLNG